MARPSHILTVRTRDGSALPSELDPLLSGRPDTSVYVYGRHDLSRRLGAGEMYPELDVNVRETDEQDWV